MQLFVGAKGLVEYGGKILLLRESSKYADGSGAGKWDVPGGRINSEEEVREGLVREIREEAGLEIMEVGQILGLFDGFPEIRGERCHVVRAYFLCRSSSNQVVLSDDHDAFEWVDPLRLEGKELLDDVVEIVRRYNAEH